MFKGGLIVYWCCSYLVVITKWCGRQTAEEAYASLVSVVFICCRVTEMVEQNSRRLERLQLHSGD